jgi:hypothetical protein
MATEQARQRADPHPTPRTTERRPFWGRPLAVATAVVFLISTAFPVVAGLSKDTEFFPAWWGTLDVGIAFVLAILALAIHTLVGGKVNKQTEDASYRAYRILTHGILVMLVVFFLFGDRIVWANCLTGLAWRAWLLLYSLPAWLALFGATASLSGSAQK